VASGNRARSGEADVDGSQRETTARDAPALHRAVRQHRAGVHGTGSDRGGGSDAEHWSRGGPAASAPVAQLPVAAVPPAHNGAIAQHGAGEIAAGGDSGGGGDAEDSDRSGGVG